MKIAKRWSKCPPVPEGHTVIVMVPDYWGRGENLEEAVKAVQRTGAPRLGTCRATVFTSADPEFFVDDYGSVCWHDPYDYQVLWQDMGRGSR